MNANNNYKCCLCQRSDDTEPDDWEVKLQDDITLKVVWESPDKNKKWMCSKCALEHVTKMLTK